MATTTTTITPSFLHLSRPLGPLGPQTLPTTSPISITLLPSALLSILDHSLRRPATSTRAIGTLLGSRSDDGTEITISTVYAVPHTETQEQVEVDMDYQKAMLNLHLRANPREVLVGWYATSGELNTFSALIHNFYGMQGDGTGPFPAVHLTVGGEAGEPPVVQAYIGAPIGVTAERAADSCSFIPVPCEVRYGDAERSGLEAISLAKDREERTVTLTSDIDGLERAIEGTLEMVERVGAYVNNVLDEEAEGSTALGQYLLNALALAPKVDAADVERDFNNHIQDILAISYLSNTIRTQIDLSNRLATAALTAGSGTPNYGNTSGAAKDGAKEPGTTVAATGASAAVDGVDLSVAEAEGEGRPRGEGGRRGRGGRQ